MKLASSPFTKPKQQVSHLMLWVVGATLPGLVALFIFFGWGVIINSLLACVFAVLFEALVLKLRERPIKRVLSDNSALLTGLLLGLSLPPLLPWWMTAIGVGFAIVFAKQLYGGLGNNLFNPAMVGYVLLLISFPLQMTSWLPPASLAQSTPDFLTTLHFIFTGTGVNGESLDTVRLGIDGYTMATPLDEMKTGINQGYRINEFIDAPIFGGLSGVGWYWVNLAFLAGGLVLAVRKVLAWQIPVSMLTAMFVTAGLLHLFAPDSNPSPVFHLFSGAAMFGAFFIATDPVTAATSVKGRIVFGAGIGIITVLIRNYGGYPDAIAFAVLLMNMAVPMIDYYTQPRVYGHAKASKPERNV